VKATFENATIADAVTKAARVAPTRGEAFDKASGILLELDEEEQTVTLRSTNLSLYYLQVVDAVEVIGSDLWRLNAQILAGVMSKLPIGSGKHVTFEQKDNELHMKSGSTKAKFRMIDTQYFPYWDAYDPDKLEMVPDLGERIKQVEWAASEDHELSFAGIHLDGTHIITTDRIRLARVPCEAEPIYKPVTIPAGILKPLLTGLRDVAVGIDEGMFLMMPDVSTQLKTNIYDRDYPPGIKAVFDKYSWQRSVKVQKSELLEVIDRASVFATRDRSPKLDLIIGKSQIAVMCSDVDMGLLGDVVEVAGADHPRHKMVFTPRNITDALNAAPSSEVELWYSPDEPKFPIKIDGGSGYMAVVMARTQAEGS
jgi:DNA polymerase III sliding clamp (beta) subunit (PCNA family)